MKKIILFIMVAASLFLITSCSQDVEEHDVYVTVYPLQFIAEELFIDTEYTVGIVPGANSHEHSVEWAAKQIIAMKESELLFYIGANFDQYIDKKLTVFEDANVELIKIEEENDYIEYIPGVIYSHNHEEDNEPTYFTNDTALGKDPHFWVSPRRMLDVLELMYDYLKDEFPLVNDTIDINYINLKVKLEALHLDFIEVITDMSKPVVTSTNLYGYLMEDYDLIFIPVAPGFHEIPDNMIPDEAEIIIQEIEEHHITKLIYELKTSSPSTDSIYAEMLLLGLEPEKLQFNILQALSENDINEGKNYITEMQANLEILRIAGE